MLVGRSSTNPVSFSISYELTHDSIMQWGGIVTVLMNKGMILEVSFGEGIVYVTYKPGVTD
jgi:putative heme iron utilization protein